MKARKMVYRKVEIALEKMSCNALKEVNGAMNKCSEDKNIVLKLSNKSVDIYSVKLSLVYMILIEIYKASNDEDFNPYNILGLYNSQIKALFLNKHPNNSQLVYIRIFEKSFDYEVKYNKDLYDFNELEMIEFLQSLEPLTKTSSNVNGRIVTSYIDNCIKLKIAKKNILKDKRMQWFDDFVQNDKLYFTDEEIRDIEGVCNNYQDLIIVRLLFLGVQGKSLSEIKNIKFNHVDWDNNKITLHNDTGEVRIVDIDEDTKYLLEKAFDQKKYLKNNGDMEGKEHVGIETYLVDNNYLIRTSLTRTDEKDRAVDKMVIYRRIQSVAKYSGYGKVLNAKNIFRSGVIKYGKELLDRRGKLEKEEYIDICNKFKINNWYQVKNYCNESVIDDMYNKEEDIYNLA